MVERILNVVNKSSENECTEVKDFQVGVSKLYESTNDQDDNSCRTTTSEIHRRYIHRRYRGVSHDTREICLVYWACKPSRNNPGIS
jgi:hypothetical protein